MSTVHDVFRRLPIARPVRPILEANEREELKALLPHIPAGGVLLCDRGYPSYDLIDFVRRQYPGYWLFRGPAQSTFPVVEPFIRSGREQALITLQPPQGETITVRAIRLQSPDGTLSVLLTNLLDAQRFLAAAIIALYFRRWAVETQYRDEKTSLDIETFHSHTENGIRQELFAILLVAVIARILMVLMTDRDHPSGAEPQLKHAIITVATEAALLTPHCPALALVLFTERLTEIARVRYYPPKTPRPAQPRVSRQPISKWQISKTKRLMNA